jgi:hypothetical protein
MNISFGANVPVVSGIINAERDCFMGSRNRLTIVSAWSLTRARSLLLVYAEEVG